MTVREMIPESSIVSCGRCVGDPLPLDARTHGYVWGIPLIRYPRAGDVWAFLARLRVCADRIMAKVWEISPEAKLDAVMR